VFLPAGHTDPVNQGWALPQAGGTNMLQSKHTCIVQCAAAMLHDASRPRPCEGN